MISTTVCPFCNKEHDWNVLDAEAFFANVLLQDYDVIENHDPRDGDWNVCAACNRISIFRDDGTLRRPTLVERTRQDYVEMELIALSLSQYGKDG